MGLGDGDFLEEERMRGECLIDWRHRFVAETGDDVGVTYVCVEKVDVESRVV